MSDPLRLSPEDQQVVDRIGREYAALKEHYAHLEELMKSKLAFIRDALTVLEDELGVYLEKVRDNSKDKSTVRTPSGTFTTQRVGAYKVVDAEQLRAAVLSGDVSPSVYGDNVHKKTLNDLLEKNLQEKGYYDLSMEEKERVDFNDYLPKGVHFSPYERTVFRKARNNP